MISLVPKALGYSSVKLPARADAFPRDSHAWCRVRAWELKPLFALLRDSTRMLSADRVAPPQARSVGFTSTSATGVEVEQKWILFLEQSCVEIIECVVSKAFPEPACENHEPEEHEPERNIPLFVDEQHLINSQRYQRCNRFAVIGRRL